MSELTEEEREKENLIDEIERPLHALVSNDICNLPMPTPEQIRARNKWHLWILIYEKYY